MFFDLLNNIESWRKVHDVFGSIEILSFHKGQPVPIQQIFYNIKIADLRAFCQFQIDIGIDSVRLWESGAFADAARAGGGPLNYPPIMTQKTYDMSILDVFSPEINGE